MTYLVVNLAWIYCTATLHHLCCTTHKKTSFRRFFAQIYDAPPPVLYHPQKNVISSIFCTNLRLDSRLPVFFSCTFRSSATTSTTLLIPKCTTRRWTLRCSNYSVAKRQQFSCPRSTATLSLKFENVVPVGWLDMIFPCYI